MKKSLLYGLGTLALVCALAGPSFAAAGKVLDDTKNAFGWRLETDMTGTKEITVVEGPKGAKALEVSYDFKDSNWIAINKDIRFAFGENDVIRFKYEGTGAAVNLQIKLFDANGNAAGFFIPEGTTAKNWKEVSIPRSALEFLWGPSQSKTLNWDSIAKFELTLDKAERTGMPYTLNPTVPGTISFSTIEIVNPSAKGTKKRR